ncbi:group I truncated hemoglobin [Actinoplanes sp. URMC 104]|uniref:group I truncated hemoglobin n=1 Tax=Actinoplanes sp. URMC 104 TaxID=3423409 RepID=UPI003F1AB47D
MGETVHYTDITSALAAHPNATTAGIAGVLTAAGIASWRLLDPARPERRAARAAARATEAAHRRSTTVAIRTYPNHAEPRPEPGTYVSITTPPVDADGRTPYQQLGPEALRAATDQFYSSVQADPLLAPYFPIEAMPHLKRHLPLLVGQLLGGPVHYEDPAGILRASHQPLGISPAAYSFLCAHLNTVLYRLRVPHEIRIFLAAQLMLVEDLIIAKELQPA